LFEDEAAAGADDSSIEGGEKSSPVVVEHVELVMTTAPNESNRIESNTIRTRTNRISRL
jgi:hypothetical protein